MGIYVKIPYTDSPISGTTEFDVALPAVNFAADFATVEDVAGTVRLTNITAPSDAPESVRWSLSPVANVYKNSGIDPNVYTSSRRGVSLVGQLNDIWEIGDTDDPTFKYSIPLSGHLVLRVPDSGYVTEDQLLYFLKRVVAVFFEDAQSDSSRLKKLLRGALKPKGL